MRLGPRSGAGLVEVQAGVDGICLATSLGFDELTPEERFSTEVLGVVASDPTARVVQVEQQTSER